MQRLSLFIMFLLSAALAIGQDRGHRYDKALQMLHGKCWVVARECVNDSCFTVNDSEYYCFPEAYHDYGVGSDSSSTGYTHLILKYDQDLKRIDLGNITCSPFWVFYRSEAIRDNSFPISICKEYCVQATIILLSESEFTVQEHHNNKIAEPWLTKDLNIVLHYKLVKTPQEILDFFDY